MYVSYFTHLAKEMQGTCEIPVTALGTPALFRYVHAESRYLEARSSIVAENGKSITVPPPESLVRSPS